MTDSKFRMGQKVKIDNFIIGIIKVVDSDTCLVKYGQDSAWIEKSRLSPHTEVKTDGGGMRKG